MNAKNTYKVDGKIYERLADARKAKREKKAGLPEDAMMTIYKAEETLDDSGRKMTMWVPFE